MRIQKGNKGEERAMMIFQKSCLYLAIFAWIFFFIFWFLLWDFLYLEYLFLFPLEIVFQGLTGDGGNLLSRVGEKVVGRLIHCLQVDDDKLVVRFLMFSVEEYIVRCHNML